MIYAVIGLVIVALSSIRTIGFAFWQFKNKNYFGGAAVLIVAAAAVALSAEKIRM